MKIKSARRNQQKQCGIEKAVIPAAGPGSRMLPTTMGIPKEMLPVGSKPMLQARDFVGTDSFVMMIPDQLDRARPRGL